MVALRVEAVVRALGGLLVRTLLTAFVAAIDAGIVDGAVVRTELASAAVP